MVKSVYRADLAAQADVFFPVSVITAKSLRAFRVLAQTTVWINTKSGFTPLS